MDWLGELDAQMERSPSFFEGKPVVLDLSSAGLQEPGLRALLQELRARDIRVIGLEGVEAEFEPSAAGHLPPVLSGGRPGAEVGIQEQRPATRSPGPASVLIEQPVRSGQTVHCPTGDVTVVGSVASGAEILAGGSIHVYGTLRGRAVAGLSGNAAARIFCRRLEAELLAIDGLYRTADEMEAGLRGRAVQARLEGNAIVVAALD